MRKKSLKFLVVLITMLILPKIAFSQDIIPVPDIYEGSAMGAINRFIMADTTATGERAHPDAIYKLERGKMYFQDQTMFIDFNFTLLADDDDPSNPTRPPMVTRGIDAEGAYLTKLYIVDSDETSIKVKNIFFQGMPSDEVIDDIKSTLFEFLGKNIRFESSQCVYNYWTSEVFRKRATEESTFILKDNIFRNLVHLSKEYSGYILTGTNTVLQDTIIVSNNTFFNLSAYMLYTKEYNGYVEFTHNTSFTTAVGALRLPYLINANFTDNIVYNYQTLGQDSAQFISKFYSIVKLNSIDSTDLVSLGISEDDRKVNYKNNVYGWNQSVKDYWSAYNLIPIPWMDEATAQMFSDYTGLVDENNLEVDPGFDPTMEAAIIDKQLEWNRSKRDTVAFKDRLYAPSGKLFDVPWPLPENLTYTNTALLTHAEGGFPVGDLNWYPAQKAAWDEWKLTGVKKENNGSIPSEYTLSQNYPNPFNPSTEMNFSIPVSGKTNLSIYNILGQKVGTLVNKELSAGSYKYQFDASNLTSGIYFYRLQSNDYSAIKKMVLLK